MSVTKSIICAFAGVALFVAGTPLALAHGDLGKFGWKLSPSCEVIVLQVSENSGVFALHGFANLAGCESPGRLVAAHGVAFRQATNIGLGFAINFPGITINYDANIDPVTLSGPYKDDLGNVGTLDFLGPR